MKNEQVWLPRRVEWLAGRRVNDAVKLAFLDGEQLGGIDGLGLGALKEFKRSGNGAVELKLMDRVVTPERLVELSGGREGGAKEFFRVLRESADAVQGLFPAAEARVHLVVFRRGAEPGGGYL